MQVHLETPTDHRNLSGSLNYINLERYPIFEPNSARGLAVLADCKAQVATKGIALLPGFLTKEALDRMVDEARSLLHLSFHSHVTGNAYLSPTDVNFGPDHVVNMTDITALGAIAYDHIPKTHALRELYECPHLMEFISSAMVNHAKLYHYADPMGALNISVMKDGDYLRWHFDQTDFVISICLQDAANGGDFEYVPNIRTLEVENYDQVKNVLLGDRELVKKLPMEPGTLLFFEGRHALHRVTQIQGPTPRLIALLGYDTKPGVKSSEYLHYLRYGRTV